MNFKDKWMVILACVAWSLGNPIAVAFAYDSAYTGAQVDASVAAHLNRQTSVGDPGSDANLVTEQAVREALDLKVDSSSFSANGLSLVGAANYAAMRSLLDLEAGTDFYSVSAADAAFVPFSGGTLTAILITDPADATASGIRLPHGTAPTSPTNGDLWTTTAGMYARINGGTVGPFGSSSGDIESIGDCTTGACTADAAFDSVALSPTSGTWDLSSLTSLTLPAWQNGATSAGYSRFMEDSDEGTEYGDLIAPNAMGSNLTWTLPSVTGTLAILGSNVFTGSQDFGGADDLELPNGAAPTVDTAGQAALDTTSDQIKYYGTAERVLHYERTECVVVENLAAADDNYEIFMANDAITITGIGVHCRGTCTTGADISLEDRAGNAMTHTTPTHSTGTGNTTFQSVTAANTLAAGEGLAFDVDNAVSPETDEYTICFTYTITAD